MAILFGMAPAVAGAQQTLRDQMLALGVSEEVVLVEYPALQLPALTSTAGTVVRVAIRASHSFLAEGGTTILTDSHAAVVEVIKDASDAHVSAGDVITIRRLGGVVDIEGRQFLSNESGFPAFTSGGEYVLFLKKDPGQPYKMVTGPQSAFRVNQGRVTPVADPVDPPAAPTVDLSVFLREVRELLNYPANSSR